MLLLMPSGVWEIGSSSLRGDGVVHKPMHRSTSTVLKDATAW